MRLHLILIPTLHIAYSNQSTQCHIAHAKYRQQLKMQNNLANFKHISAACEKVVSSAKPICIFLQTHTPRHTHTQAHTHTQISILMYKQYSCANNTATHNLHTINLVTSQEKDVTQHTKMVELTFPVSCLSSWPTSALLFLCAVCAVCLVKISSLADSWQPQQTRRQPSSLRSWLLLLQLLMVLLLLLLHPLHPPQIDEEKLQLVHMKIVK